MKDNGIGIDASHHEDIFVIHKREHTGTSFVGSGIGLAICKKIVQRHGGMIWVESDVGSGATFYFTIPQCETDTMPEPPAEPEKSADERESKTVERAA